MSYRRDGGGRGRRGGGRGGNSRGPRLCICGCLGCGVVPCFVCVCLSVCVVVVMSTARGALVLLHWFDAGSTSRNSIALWLLFLLFVWFFLLYLRSLLLLLRCISHFFRGVVFAALCVLLCFMLWFLA